MYIFPDFNSKLINIHKYENITFIVVIKHFITRLTLTSLTKYAVFKRKIVSGALPFIFSIII